MEWVAVLLLFLFMCVLLNLLLPQPPPSRWRRRLTSSVSRRARLFRRREVPAPDPFDTLRVQTRLAHLSGKIRRLESTPRIFARAHHLKALEAAYDDLLDEACRLAGVPDDAESLHGEEKRWHEEQELTSRGWSW